MLQCCIAATFVMSMLYIATHVRFLMTRVSRALRLVLLPLHHAHPQVEHRNILVDNILKEFEKVASMMPIDEDNMVGNFCVWCGAVLTE
jgi:hypothetical protein